MGHERGITHLLCGKAHARGPGGDDEAVARLAGRQHGTVARQQLLDLGISGRSIDHRLLAGRLRRLMAGVYAVGHETLCFRGRVSAALLAAARTRSPATNEGPPPRAGRHDVAASHLTAAVLWRLTDRHPGWPHVSSGRQCARRSGVVPHRAVLPPDEIRLHEGFPVTTVPRTLLDLSGMLAPDRLRRLVKEAEFQELVDGPGLDAILSRYPRRRGRRSLARIVESGLVGAGRTRSELEDRFLGLCRRQRLPLPETNVRLEAGGERLEVDCAWREPRVVVELDGYQAHGGRLAFERDRRRDRLLAAAGWLTLRVTWEQLRTAPETLSRELRDALALRGCA
ncbi:MAG TPA: DUF559 domain-containing protein [Solirubrobacterales bacterium]|nr:DUF559 domain-containing protein [Solirubrobacterales bacterium]